MTRPAASFGAWQTMMPQQQPQQHSLTNSEDGQMQHEAGNKRQARQHEASLCSTCNTCRSAGGQVQRKLRAARSIERGKERREAKAKETEIARVNEREREREIASQCDSETTLPAV